MAARTGIKIHRQKYCNTLSALPPVLSHKKYKSRKKYTVYIQKTLKIFNLFKQKSNRVK